MQRDAHTFALAGAAPAFAEPVHVGRPNQPDREAFLRRVNDVLDRNWLTNNGPLVAEFEQRVAETIEVPHCVAVSSGTLGLQILYRSLDVTQPVVMPSFTFVATPASAAWLGIDPALVDIESVNYGLDPRAVEELDDVGAIVGVHVWGLPCSTVELEAVAAQRSCPLILDAAHAFATSVDGRVVGGAGTAEVFSFHATKLAHTFEGGAVTTTDEALAAELRGAINFGFEGYDRVGQVGINGKLNEISAAMGLAMLDHLPIVLARNRANRAMYEHCLADIPGITLVTARAGVETNDHYVVLLVDEDDFGIGRDDLYRYLHSENVLVRRYFHPGIHRMEPYTRFAGDRQFPTTDHVAGSCLALPTGLAVGDDTIRRIGELIAGAQENGATIVGLLDGVPWP